MIVLDIDLPRKDDKGVNYISYSQYTSFKSDSGFNTGLPGYQEYIRSYFLGERFPDAGWAQFGKDVEDYICERKSGEMFSQRERDVLEKVEPLGNFQIEVKLWLASNLYLLGYIDDATHDLMKVRDYKTGSDNSLQKYTKPDYEQLDFYSMWVKQETGRLPNELEVCGIERKGNVFGLTDRRDLLTVGEKVTYIPRETSEERCENVKNNLLKVVFEISDYYKIFKKYG